MYRALGEGKVLKQSWWTFFRNLAKVFKMFDEAKKDTTPEGSNTNVRPCPIMCFTVAMHISATVQKGRGLLAPELTRSLQAGHKQMHPFS